MKEINTNVIDVIIKEVNNTLARLGISEPVRVSYNEVRGGKSIYHLASAPINHMPVMFKELTVEGSIFIQDNTENDKRDRIMVRLSYSYKHFGGGSNGCDIGCMVFAVKKNAPQTFDMDDDAEYYVKKVQGLMI